jgi:hypothetical protein
MVPAGVLATMPDALKKVWLDTPIWKVLAVLVLIILSALLVLSWAQWARAQADDLDPIISGAYQIDGLPDQSDRSLDPSVVPK